MKKRLDALLVERGLAQSRERARALIIAGRVRVGGTPVTKSGTPVPPDADIALAEADHPFVSRGALKLGPVLERFGIEVAGREALDVGASTGGFTQVLLSRGARTVVALDVGRGQLHWDLRRNPRVVVVEGINARTLAPATLPADHRLFDVVTIDVSFISLRLILPVIPALLRPGADVVALVKPQFEAGRGEVGAGGIVRDPAVQARVVDEVAAAADRVGLRPVDRAPSPVSGAEGNQEFFLHLRRRLDAGNAH